MLDLEQHADPVTTAQADDYTRLPVVPAGTFIAPLQRPAGLGADWLESRQRGYTREEHAVWNTLYERLLALLPGRACDEYLQGLEQLGLGQNGVPSLECINQTLMRLSGWRVVPVPMLIPDHVFFFHLANRRFPAGNFIRDANSLDYIQAPDVFHDVMGHVPLLADSVFADYMQAYGRAGWRALRYNRLKALSALYWYTVEFG
ncbi:MAG: phenylalanine 4-monooxygenase, partial [Gammaproteobacteria bacterium]|nr:phenylalanine 4-monooxygenase [Gammaproteobacteria bacterium]